LSADLTTSATAASRAEASELDSWHDLVPSAERRELVDTVRRHLAAAFPLDSVRRCYASGRPAVDAWSHVAAADYASIGLPADRGGIGSFVDTVAMLEAAGQALLPAPLLSTAMSLQTLSRLEGRPEGRDTELEPARPAALALAPVTAADGGPVPRGLLVLDAAVAERLTIVSAGESGTRIAQFDTGALASAEIVTHVDPSRPVSVVEPGDATPLFVVDDPRGVDEVLAPARAAMAADLTGVAAAALQGAVDHAVRREQFGRKIGAFQSVKHRLADLYVALERARSLTRAAAIAVVARGGAQAAELSLLAKAAAGDVAVDATRSLVQVLGAMGMTDEADAHLYFRRAQQTVPFLGSSASCYRRAVLARRGRGA